MPQGRRSRLIIRRVDPWTVFKFSALLYVSTYFVVLVAGIVLWAVATATGVRGNIESFVGELIASEKFEFEAGQILKSSVLGGAVLVAVGTFFNVLLSVLFNLISDVVGGIGISVEERPPRPRKGRRRQAGRPPATARLTPGKAPTPDGQDTKTVPDEGFARPSSLARPDRET